MTLSVTGAVTGLPITSVTQTLIFHDDGSINVPLTQGTSTLASVQSASVMWPAPAVLATRRPQVFEMVLSVREAGRAFTQRSNVTVQGLGTQAVRVPAGSYHATVINQAFSIKYGKIITELELRSWLAPGIGIVKSQTIDVNSASRQFSGVQLLRSVTG